MYLTLAYLLEYGTFPPHVRDAPLPNLVQQPTFASWRVYHLGTTALFNESCDCYRPDTRGYLNVTIENRFMRQRALNISVSYLLVNGYQNVKSSGRIGYADDWRLTPDNYGERALPINTSVELAFAYYARTLAPADLVIANQGAWLDASARRANVGYFRRFLTAVEMLPLIDVGGDFCVTSESNNKDDGDGDNNNNNNNNNNDKHCNFKGGSGHARRIWRTTIDNRTDTAALDAIANRTASWHVLDSRRLVLAVPAGQRDAVPNSCGTDRITRTHSSTRSLFGCYSVI